ncbi:hypothetical protein Tco_1197879, partial [Tanacetum coccineum]
FDEAVHEFSLVNVCWLLRSTQVSLRKYAKRSRVSIVYWKFDIGKWPKRKKARVMFDIWKWTKRKKKYKHKEVIDNINGCFNVIKCLRKETITKKNQMVFKQLFEFATGVSVANDIKKSNGKRVREIDAKFSDLGLEKRIKQVKRDLGRYL